MDVDFLEKTLKERFHLPGFRPLQREIIEGILEEKNVIAVLATGGGKSLCFQLPALLIGRLTLVITPLVELMEDQVKRVLELGISGTYISSVLDEEEKRYGTQHCFEGKGLFPVVSRRDQGGRTGRLCTGQGMYDHSTGWIRPLGIDPETF